MKIQQFKRKFNITAQSWATGNYTLTTNVAHGLAVGDTVVLFSLFDQASQTVTCAAGTTGSTIVFADATSGKQFNSNFNVPYFTTNMTSDTESPGTTFTTYQATVTTTSGNGAGVATIQGSNDGIGWFTLATLTCASGVSPVSTGTVYQGSWIFVRSVISGLTGTGAKMYVSYNG